MPIWQPKTGSPRVARRAGAPSFWAYMDRPARTFPGDPGDVADLAGSTPAGVRAGGCTWADGPRGKCLSFDGSTGRASFDPSATATLNGSAFTISVSFSLDPAATHSNFIVGMPGRSHSRVLGWNWGSADALYFGEENVTTGTSAPFAASTYARVMTDVSVVFAAGAVLFYVDGRAIGSGSMSFSASDSGPFVVGGGPSGASDKAIGGLVDGVRIYPRALTPAEVARDHADPNWRLLRPGRLLAGSPSASPACFAGGPVDGNATNFAW